MNVQLMTLDINSMRGTQKASNQQVTSKKEDFSYVLDKSRKRKEELVKSVKPVEQKINKANETSNQISGDKPKVELKNPESQKVDKVKELALEDEVLAKEKLDNAMASVAELLGITVEELEHILVAMQIGLSDLLEGNNLQQLIMEVSGTEDPMELLLVPELGRAVKEVTAVLEDYTAEIVKLGVNIKLLEAGQEDTEVILKTEFYGASHENQKDEVKDQQLEANSESIVAEIETPSKTKLVTQSSEELSRGGEELSQSEEQSAANQNNPANQFLDNLSQSMGEVFQGQNNAINESLETISKRTEVVNPKMVLDQIVEKIKVSSLENEAQMTIQLKPEHLGKLSMEVISKQGILTAQITVENEKTKALLDQNIQSLRESLDDKGLVIQELEVTVGQNQNEERQTYQDSKLNRNVSDIISSLMNEEVIIEEVEENNLFDYNKNEVDYIA